MVDPILQRRGFQLVPMQKSHVMKFYHDIAPYSAAEYEDVDLFYALDQMQEEQDCMVLENPDGISVQLIGLQATGNQQVCMWSLFTKQMDADWRSVIRISPDILRHVHQTYYEINLNISVDNEGSLNWAAWLGFSAAGYIDDEDGTTLVHFVRCNPDRKNVYALASRPVMH